MSLIRAAYRCLADFHFAVNTRMYRAKADKAMLERYVLTFLRGEW